MVFPEPDTPATTVMHPRGMPTSMGCTVWMADVAMRMAPLENTSPSGTLSRTTTGSSPLRYGAMMDPGSASTSSTVPWDTTVPPPLPAPGPISTIQSAILRALTSWSTMTTELPWSTRSRTISIIPSRLDGCRPMDGSSRTYITPVVRFLSALASCTLWRSPVDSVDPARSRER